MTKTPWIAGAALSAALAVAAYAQPVPPADGPPPPPQTRAELQARIADQFKLADANHDGFVTQAEFDAVRNAMRAKFAEHREERRAREFAMLDKDKNGSLSKQEFLAPPPPPPAGAPGPDGPDGGPGGPGDGDGMHRGHGGPGRFARHDMGPGGPGGPGMGGNWFARADANKDGKVSLAEAQAGALAMFDRIDTNKDGKISPEERDAARAQWKDRRGGPTG